MTLGPRTRALLRLTSERRMRQIETAYHCVTQACASVGHSCAHAEFIGEEDLFAAWALPRAHALAHVHHPGDTARAQALITGARLMQSHGLPVLRPLLDRPVTAGDRPVTFWERPRGDQEAYDPVGSAHATAAVHGLTTDPARLAGRHDPFAGLLDGLGRSPMDAADKQWLHRHAITLRARWQDLDWPTPPTTVLGDRHLLTCHSHRGAHPQVALRQPLRLGQREWDIAAARWRSDLLRGHEEEYRLFAPAYARSCTDLPPGVDLTEWAGYRTLRQILALVETMREVRRAHLGPRIHREALLRIACLRGRGGPAPWRWSGL